MFWCHILPKRKKFMYNLCLKCFQCAFWTPCYCLLTFCCSLWHSCLLIIPHFGHQWHWLSVLLLLTKHKSSSNQNTQFIWIFMKENKLNLLIINSIHLNQILWIGKQDLFQPICVLLRIQHLQCMFFGGMKLTSFSSMIFH